MLIDPEFDVESECSNKLLIILSGRGEGAAPVSHRSSVAEKGTRRSDIQMKAFHIHEKNNYLLDMIL
ncbi:MAG: hypothetical protein AB2693_33330 [Candidatus Thiodiazotropha sp.]